MTVKLVLASGSPSRARLLQSVGINPKIVVSDVNEEDDQFAKLSPGELVIALAILKAHTVAKTIDFPEPSSNSITKAASFSSAVDEFFFSTNSSFVGIV